MSCYFISDLSWINWNMFHGVKRFASISVAVAGGASVLGYAFRDQLPVVHGSWTTNHKPSVPWDWNWDK